MRLRVLRLLLIIGLTWASTASATAYAQQASNWQGVTWEVPAGLEQAKQDLQQMHQMGIRAVRTGPIEDEKVLAVGDSLGLRFYQELPVEHLPAAQLQDTLQTAKRALLKMLNRAQGHPSARYFGLGRLFDASSPKARPYVQALAAVVRQQETPTKMVYYVSSFVEDDCCADLVDLVLLHVPVFSSPVQVLQRWSQAHPQTPAGIANLGAGMPFHTRTDFQQAQQLETTLHQLLEQPSAYVVFIQQWWNGQLPRENLLTSGPHNPSVAAVVQGFYTGRQTNFTLPQQAAAAETIPGLILLGWGIIFLLALLYALSPRFRKMLPRYFWNHRSYQEAIRRGREVIAGESMALLVIFMAVVGLTAAVWVDRVEQSFTLHLALSWLPENLQFVLHELLQQPWLVVTLVGSIMGLALVGWAGWLASISRRLDHPLGYEQTFMLTVWPHWVLLPAAGLAWIGAGTADLSGWLLMALWLAGMLYATVRTWTDFRAITRIRPIYLFILAPSSPVVLLLLTVAFLALENHSKTTFVWHLFTRL